MAGFRKSFLGFNCDDVINYIQAAQAKFNRRETELNDEIALCQDKLSKAQCDIDKLNEEKDTLLAELNSFKSRCDEIEQLSISIGKLYLVSQNSAKNIINNSVESSRRASEEILKNMESIEDAHVALAEIKSRIKNTTENFMSDVENLCSSLEDTKRVLAERNENSNLQLEEFTAMFNKINNAE